MSAFLDSICYAFAIPFAMLAIIEHEARGVPRPPRQCIEKRKPAPGGEAKAGSARAGPFDGGVWGLRLGSESHSPPDGGGEVRCPAPAPLYPALRFSLGAFFFLQPRVLRGGCLCRAVGGGGGKGEPAAVGGVGIKPPRNVFLFGS